MSKQLHVREYSFFSPFWTYLEATLRVPSQKKSWQRQKRRELWEAEKSTRNGRKKNKNKKLNEIWSSETTRQVWGFFRTVASRDKIQSALSRESHSFTLPFHHPLFYGVVFPTFWWGWIWPKASTNTSLFLSPFSLFIFLPTHPSCLCSLYISSLTTNPQRVCYNSSSPSFLLSFSDSLFSSSRTFSAFRNPLIAPDTTNFMSTNLYLVWRIFFTRIIHGSRISKTIYFKREKDQIFC